jgi:hypothetical protein
MWWTRVVAETSAAAYDETRDAVQWPITSTVRPSGLTVEQRDPIRYQVEANTVPVWIFAGAFVL